MTERGGLAGLVGNAARSIAAAARESPGRTAGVAGAVGAAVALGIAAGVAAERVVVGRALRTDTEENEPFGSLRGAVVPVIASDGTPLHVEVDDPTPGSIAARTGDNLTIVFSHGFALAQDTWHYQRRDLAPLVRMVFWDQRSHGRSGRGTREFATIEQLGKDLAAVVDATCPPGTPVILAGHSMGGMTVMSYADLRRAEFGERVRGAALVSTSAGGLADIGFGLPPALAKSVHRAMPGVTSALVWQKELVERTRRAGRDAGLAITRAYSFGSDVSLSLAEFVHRLVWSTPIDVVAEFLPTLDEHDKVVALGALRHVETLVVSGDADRLIPVSHSEAIVAELPDAAYVRIVHGGHMALLEFYPQLNAAFRDLIARVRSDPDLP